MRDAPDAANLRTELEPLADDRGEITGDRPTLTVTYETRQGNERTRTGDVWRLSDGGTFDDAVIRFSADIGGDEDPYFVRVRGDDATLVSISERGSETDLGAIVGVELDTPDAVADGGNSAADIRTVIADATLAGVTDDADVTDGVASIEPDSTLAACRSNDPLLNFAEFAAVRGVEA